jgi:hypothetical protein
MIELLLGDLDGLSESVPGGVKPTFLAQPKPFTRRAVGT